VNSLREDKDSQILNKKDVLSNAKEINMQQVKIPRVFDNE
jgi:Asp-tRNA(Asn)/Glu-tRNA(Gln) amidotransferase C subunit